MLRRSEVLLKKGWTYNPGQTRRGGKNLAFRPKMPKDKLDSFLFLDMQTPSRIPETWQGREFDRLEMIEYPKAVGFYNAGDNFELTPEMMYRLFRRNQAEKFWTPAHNERAVIALMPVVEKDPVAGMRQVQEIFAAHVARFGADHTIYNAVMQAAGFARDFERCQALFTEMQGLGLVPNAQTVVNMMLAVRLTGRPVVEAEKYFAEGIRLGALRAVMRLDTEFRMWWDQLERMGSFTEGAGFLGNNEEGARSRPRDLFAIWGWDKTESKFVPRAQYIKTEAERRGARGGPFHMQGTVFSGLARQPWFKYQGMHRADFRGPAHPPAQHAAFMAGAPVPAPTTQVCGTAY